MRFMGAEAKVWGAGEAPVQVSECGADFAPLECDQHAARQGRFVRKSQCLLALACGPRVILDRRSGATVDGRLGCSRPRRWRPARSRCGAVCTYVESRRPRGNSRRQLEPMIRGTEFARVQLVAFRKPRARTPDQPPPPGALLASFVSAPAS